MGHRRLQIRNTWRKRPRGWQMVAVIAASIAVGIAIWAPVYRYDTRKLSEDTRVVVRIPAKLFDEMTADVVDEQLPFRETAKGATFEGVAHAAGIVRVAVNGDTSDPGFVVRVQGKTFGPITGVRSPVTLEGEGRGTFDAEQIIRFDGRNFRAGELTVTSGYETTIRKLEAMPGTPLAGAVRLVAMRSARATLPEFNRVAARLIEERVRARVRTMVEQTLERLRRINRIDEMIAIVHPDREWTIHLESGADYVQAALVPAGGTVPALPVREDHSENYATIEVWMRLTRSERGFARVASQWNVAHRLLRRYLPEEKARPLAENLRLQRIGDWTRLSVGAAGTRSLHLKLQSEAAPVGTAVPDVG